MLLRSPWLTVLSAALAIGVTACDSTPTTTTTSTATDTSNAVLSILVRPQEFLGDTPCSSAPGAMQSYVATLVDRTFAEVCGDGVCQPQETDASCALDCEAGHSCGNNTCDAAKGETKDSCPVDCGGTLKPPFTLASSLPTPCSVGVRFENILAAHSYTAFIDGYEENADDIWPETVCGDAVCRPPETAQTCAKDCGNIPDCGDGKCSSFGKVGQSKETAANCPLDCGAFGTDYTAMRSGNRHMQYADTTGKPASPRWLGACGDGDQARTVASASGTTLLYACEPMEDLGAGSEVTAVQIAPQDALGFLECAADATGGELGVATFDVESENGLGDLLGVACQNPSFVQTYSGDTIVPGSSLSFFISARAEKGGDVLWGSTCSVLVEEGLTVRAACAPLSDKGMVRVDISSALAAHKLSCDASVSYDALLAGATSLKQNGVSCSNPVTFGPVAPGLYAVSLSVHSATATTQIDCTAQVQPGRTTTAACL